MAPIALQDFSYNRVPDPDASDVEAGPATSSGRDEQREGRARRWHLALAFGLGVLFSAACYGLWHLSGRSGTGAVAGGKAGGASDASEVQGDTTTTSTSTSSAAAPTSTSAADKPLTLHFHGEPSINKHGPISAPDCPITVEYTADEATAEGVVYNSDSYEGINQDERDRRRIGRPWQKQVIWGSESAPNRAGLERYFRSIKGDGTSDLYDADMTYRLNGSVPGTYAYGYMDFSNMPVAYDDKRQDKIAAAFVSNCHPKNARNLILDSLLEMLPGQVDSFGSCKNNADAEQSLRDIGHWEQAGSSPTRWNIKITTLSYYKFSVALENSNDLDYVTEKYYQPLERGSVPIVFGAPDYAKRFFPSPNAAINVADYLSPSLTTLSNTDSEAPEKLSDEDKAGLARLAERLKFLSSAEGREDYDSMLAWKNDDKWKTESPFGKIVELSKGPYDRDCKLAGVLRGLDWAKSTWTPPEEG